MAFRRFALTALVLMVLSVPALSEVTEDSDDAAQEPAWREFHFSERGFVASFPGIDEKPKPRSTPVSGQNPLLQHDYQVKMDKHTVYTVVVFEYPEGRAPNPPKNDYFDKVVTAYAKGSDTSVRSKAAKRIDGRAGYEAVAEDGRGAQNHLIDLVANGDRIYMIISAGRRGHARSKDAKRFRESFRLLGGPPPPSSDSN
jgi:hypothetical protein